MDHLQKKSFYPEPFALLAFFSEFFFFCNFKNYVYFLCLQMKSKMIMLYVIFIYDIQEEEEIKQK